MTLRAARRHDTDEATRDEGRMMKRTKAVTKKKLYISELERPACAAMNDVTTLAIGEECGCGDKKDNMTTLALGEES